DGVRLGFTGDAPWMNLVLCRNRVAVMFVADDAVQPGADITAARNRGKVVYKRQNPDLGEPLQHAEVEGGAANASAGEGKSQGARAMCLGERLRRRIVGGKRGLLRKERSASCANLLDLS